MGLLDKLLGAGSKPPTIDRSSEVRELAGMVGNALGEILMQNKWDDVVGFTSKSGVVGVYSEKKYDKGEILEVKFEELEKKEGSIGKNTRKVTWTAPAMGQWDGTFVDRSLFDKIKSMLDSTKLDYQIFVSNGTAKPMMITTKIGNIYLAPIIQNPRMRPF
jgi:hypothetical protein